LKPVASPVWCGGTASMIRFGIAANASPMPLHMTTLKAITSTWLPCASASSARPSAVRKPPSASGTLLPTRPPRIPEIGPSASIARQPGTSSNPARVASTPKP
jgi:hypothetical protein